MKGKKIKVLFDANPMVGGQRSGVGYYTSQLIEALAKNYPDGLELVGHYFNFLGRKKPQLPRLPNIRYKTSRLLPGKILSLLRRTGLQLPFDLLVKSRGDIALFPNFVSLPLLQSAKRVVVIHDLCFEDFPQYLRAPNRNFLKKFVPASVTRADLVITVSESTKRAVMKHYKINPDKLLITPIPPPTPDSKIVLAPNKLNLPRKYVLFVGTLEPRKNYLSLVKGYSLLPDSLKKEYGLVLAGQMGWDTKLPMAEIRQLQKSGEKIAVTGYVDEATRAYLYQNASLLAMPSHYEGFGMPILEAMSYGVPVVASDIPVFHEVAGEAAMYFDKDDPVSIASSLNSLLSDESLREQLLEKSVVQLKKFDWDKIARDVMLNFKRIANDQK